MSPLKLTYCPYCQSSEIDEHGVCSDCGRSHGPRPREVVPQGDPIVGQVVADRYRVTALLGEGGMGKVYLGEQVELGRPVALKMLLPHLAADPQVKARFHREAKAASRLHHPNSVIVYDFGEWERQLYITMEYLRGQSLADLLEQHYPLEPGRIIDIMLQVCSVLKHAHEMGMLHRDLKPDNVMLVMGPGDKEMVKVVDFGLALVIGPAADTRLTMDGMVSGTPDYMSPEQCRTLELDERSDLYSLGVILYELLAGFVPFDAESSMDVLIHHLFTPPVPPSEAAPEAGIDPNLEAIALKLMAKEPDDRFQSAAEVRDALLSARQGLGAAPGEVSAPPSPVLASGRAERAAALGLTVPSQRAADTTRALQGKAAVVWEPDGDEMESISNMLKAVGMTVHSCPTVDMAIQEATHRRPVAVIADLRRDVDLQLALLFPWLDGGTLGGAPVVVAGPDDSFDVMNRVLRMGIGDYVPGSSLGTKLFKTLSRILKKAGRQSRG